MWFDCGEPQAITDSTFQPLNTRTTCAQAKDAGAARGAWEAARGAINRFARVVNTRAPPTLPPLGEI